MALLKVAAEWQLSWEEQMDHRAFLCCNSSLNRGSQAGAQEKLHGIAVKKEVESGRGTQEHSF